MRKTMETVADQFMEFLVRDKGRWAYHNVDGHEGQARELQTRLASSRRFIIEDDAVDVAGTLARSNAEVLARLLPSARPPASRTWLEWSEAAQARSTGFIGEADGHDLRMGALIESDPALPNRYTIDLFMKDWVGPVPGARPDGFIFTSIVIGFRVDTDAPLTITDRTDEVDLARLLKTSPKAFSVKLMGLPLLGPLHGMTVHDPAFYDVQPDMFGHREHRMKVDDDGRPVMSAAAMEKLDLTAEEIEARYQSVLRIVDHVAHRLTKSGRSALKKLPSSPYDVQVTSVQALGTMAAMHSTKLAFILALLALMNNPALVDGDTSIKAGKNRSVGARTLPYLELRIIRLRLTRNAAVEQEVRRIVGRMSPRHHEVDGHWRTSHRRGRDDCEHAWVSLTANRQSCALCEGLRWWVAGHERGAEATGRVVSDRRVTR